MAEQEFVDTFQKGNVPDEVVDISADYTESLIAAGVVASKSELRRLLDAGGVRDASTGEKLEVLPERVLEPKTLKIGKRRFVKLLP
jgi:tyrosyl-tRNA synthetase